MDDNDYTKEQKELLEKPKLVIMPSFNDEWVIETYDSYDQLAGRFNATDAQMAVAAVRAALTDNDGPADFETN